MDPTLQLVQVTWIVSLPSVISTTLNLVTSANLLRAHVIPLSMWLIKMSNSTSLKMGSWRILLVTSLHLDIDPMTTTLWIWPSKQFFSHWIVYPSNLYLSNLEMRCGMEPCQKPCTNPDSCLSVAFPFSIGTVTLSQKATRSALGEAILALSYHLFISYMP